MFRKYLSGAQKRKRKAELCNKLHDGSGSLTKYLTASDGQQPCNSLSNVMGSSVEEIVPDPEHRTFSVVGIPSEETSKLEIAESATMGILLEGTCSKEDAESSTSHDKVHNKLEQREIPLDVGLWPNIITDEICDYFIVNKPPQCIQLIDSSKHLIGKRERMLTEQNFYRKTRNGELVNREWLIYSPNKCALFCYVCKLFSSSGQALCKDGFSYWKNTTERLHEHENSAVHRKSVICLAQRVKSRSRIDCQLIEEYQNECAYWRKVLTRVVAAVKFLAQRGLPFFGRNETLGSSQNGNFLGSLELISIFDQFLADHLTKYGNIGTGKVNYLSSTIVTEFIEIMAEKVQSVIIHEMKESKYFGLIVDSTPDIMHIDQLAVIFRYVTKEGVPVERFVEFIPIHGHSSSHLTDKILLLLKKFDLDVSNCRGQSYDNASNMSGKYSGLQARIKEVSPLAEYVPCSAHSLNLVGLMSVECCHYAVSFFGLVQTIYVFFAASTHRWEILIEHLAGKLTLKSVCSTRWSAAADASKALRKGYNEIREALHSIFINSEEKASARHEAKALFGKMEKFETAILTTVWDTILQRLNNVNKTLQSTTGDISVIIPLYDSLIKFVQSVRDDFKTYEAEASTYVKNTYAARRKKLDCGNPEDLKSDRDVFIVQCHYVICDSLITELLKRKNAYVVLEERFQFLVKRDITEENIKKGATLFKEIYSVDVDDEFCDEVCQFYHFSPPGQSTPEEMLQMLRTQGIVHTFPNIDVALRILLTIPISNSSSERSFSALKRIKTRLRATVGQDNLTGLSILAIENDLTQKLDFEDVINTFSAKKTRKRPI